MTLDALKTFVADLARPFALYSVAGSTSFAIVRLTLFESDLSAAAVFITAALGGLAALYGVKAWENAKAGGQAAEVEKVRAQATPPPTEALKPAAPAPDPEAAAPEDPPWVR